MKEIDLNLLREKGYCCYDRIRRRLVPDRFLPSYCERCRCQRVHNLVSFSGSMGIFECTFCKEEM